MSYAERNISGFSALPAGSNPNLTTGVPSYFHQTAWFVTATEYSADQNWRSPTLYVYSGQNSITGSWNTSWTGICQFNHQRYSVRCIRNTVTSFSLSRTPGSSQVGAGTSVAYTASITNDDPSGYTYTWTVDGTAQSETSNTFNYTFNESGNHTVACEATGNGNTFTKSLSTTVVVTPEVSTSAATGVGFNVATVGGNVTEVGYPAITARGICYNTTGTPTVSDTKVADESATAGAYTASLTGLADHTTYYVRAYATNSVGTVYGEEVTFTTLQCGVDQLTDVDGNSYNTLVLGTQCWIKSNLRTTKFADGTDITRSYAGTSSTTTPYYCEPTSDQNADDLDGLYDVNTWGRYYNHPAVTASNGLCPTGWHVPTRVEFNTLFTYVGNTWPCDGNSSNYVKALASPLGWSNADEPVYGYTATDDPCTPAYLPENNNASGFSLFGGTGIADASRFGYYNGYEVALWTSEAASSSNGWACDFYTAGSYVQISSAYTKAGGFTVRCLRDN